MMLILLSVVLAAEPPPKIAKMLDRGNAERAQAIKALEQSEAELLANLKMLRKAPYKVRAKARDELKAIRTELKQLKAGKPYVPKLDFARLTVGDIGKLADTDWQCVQVLTKDRFLAHFRYTHIYYTGQTIGNVRQHQETRTSKLYLIDGIDTSSMADDKPIRLAGTFEVTGTYDYVSAGGAKRTVYVLSPIDVSEWLE